MIIDTSVIIAILKYEPDGPAFRNAIRDSAENSTISAATLFEARIVVERLKNETVRQQLEDLITDFGITVVPFTPEQSLLAMAAYRTFGKGSGHPAQLNFGDCFAYALAKERGEPLLFKGNDFAQTDLVAA